MNNNSVITTAMETMNSYDAFCHNPDNFLHSDKSRNSELDKTADLARKFGYSTQQFGRIKALADMQFLEEIGVDGTDEVTVDCDKEWMTINSPWLDSSARFELTDIGAVNCYGEEVVREWSKKANKALQNKELLAELKNWSERTSYVEKYPYRNPIERFGLVW